MTSQSPKFEDTYQYHDLMLGYARKLTHNEHDAQDIVQDAYRKLWQHWPNYVARGSDVGSHCVSAVRSAYGNFFDGLQAVTTGKANHTLVDFTDYDRFLEIPEPEASYDEDGFDRLDAMLSVLTEKQREATRLRHAHGMTFVEVGAALGVPKAAAQSRAKTGLAKLRKLYEVC